MTDKEFIRMMLEERIKCLSGRLLTQKEAEILSEGERILEELEEEKKEKVQKFLDLTMEMEAENEKQTYLGGLRDGIRLADWIAGINREKCL